jgi:hypothetical protein
MTTIRRASNVICIMVVIGLSSCSRKEQVASSKNVSETEYTLVSPIAGPHCKNCHYGTCGVSCEECDNGLEYYCMKDFSGKKERR